MVTLMKILIAGFQHETNTFVARNAHYENFANGETFPAMKRGERVFDLRHVNIPVGGFINEIEPDGHTLIAVLWAGAGPSAHVARDTFERIAGEIVEAAGVHAPDAVYLDLHGAMVAEHTDDGEGELLARVRGVVGPDVPVVASLDLHANVTERMLACADALVAYRTYPHVDMAPTGARAARLVRAALAGERWHCASRRIPFLIPLNAMCTLVEPARPAYEHLERLERDGLASMSFALGFPAADFPECGPVVWAYATQKQIAEDAVGTFFDGMVGSEAAWAVEFLAPEEAVAQAMRLSDGKSKPVVIADTQDNPGAGGESDTTGMLRALLSEGARNAAFGVVHDPDAAYAAEQAGVGSTIGIELGGESGLPDGARFRGTFEVVRLSEGNCVFDGPMLNGMAVQLGTTALLKIGDVLVIVSSQRPPQMMDRNLYRLVGIEPEKMRILVNKSSVHFRADFDAIACATLVAKAPGGMRADPRDLPWKHLRRGLRVAPLGPAFGETRG